MGMRRAWTSYVTLGSLCAAGAIACGQAPDPGSSESTSASSTSPIASGALPRHGARVRSGSDAVPLLTPVPADVTPFTDHGGPVMTGPTNVYFIWYGDWSHGTVKILTDFITSLGGSTYWAMNTQYPNGLGQRPANRINYGGSTIDHYSKGTAISIDDVATIVADAVSASLLPSDPNAVYFVLTSPNVTVPGFCSDYCGYHVAVTVSGDDLKYAFVGGITAASCGGCVPAEIANGSPNQNVTADAMANIMTHELEEAVTDPHEDAWYGISAGQENGDSCNFSFGDTYPAPNGGMANVHLGARDFLIQRDIIPVGMSSCALELHYTHASGDTQGTRHADFDGDGIGDVLWRNQGSGDLSVWLMNADGTPRSTILTASAIDPRFQIDAAADFDADGKADLLWRDTWTGDVSSWTMNGGTPVSTNVLYRQLSNDWQIAGTADFDGDSKADILWRNMTTGDVSIWTMNGKVPAAFIPVRSGVPLEWQIAGTGDFDGDRSSDILWRDTKTGEISVWIMRALQPVYFVTANSLASNVDIAAIGDVDGDTRSDVVLRDMTSGDVTAWLMNGGTIGSTVTLYRGAPREWRIYGADDMSGDRTADLLWRDARTGDVSVWMMQNAAPARFVLTASAIPLSWQIMAE